MVQGMQEASQMLTLQLKAVGGQGGIIHGM